MKGKKETEIIDQVQENLWDIQMYIVISNRQEKGEKRMNIEKGDIFEFGAYKFVKNGARLPIRWKAVDIKEEKALLLSEYVLFLSPYHSDIMGDISWGVSDIRKWLNGEFLEQAFDTNEKKIILKTVLEPGNIPCFFGPHQTTEDKVFLLSLDEIDKLSYEDLAASPSPYMPCHYQAYCCFSKHRRAGGISYWLRSPASKRYLNAYVGPCGDVEHQGAVPSMPIGVRPAIWIDFCAGDGLLKKVQKVGGIIKFRMPRELAEDFEHAAESLEDAEEDEDNNRDTQSTVGKTFLFGQYPQHQNGQPLPIEWRVLSIDDEKALIIADRALDTKPYNGGERSVVSWETCSLREWLNGEFLEQSFTSDERTYILSTTLETERNPDYCTSSGEKTVDHVFLLSYDEIVQFLKDGSFYEGSGGLCIPTELAVVNGAALSQNIKAKSREGKWESTSSWWTRTSGDTEKAVMYVSFDGSFDIHGDEANSESNVVRPAMFISKDLLSSLSPKSLKDN